VTPTRGPQGPLTVDPEPLPELELELELPPLSLVSSEGVVVPPVEELELHAAASAKANGIPIKYAAFLMTTPSNWFSRK
jgi:hypothetical protein